MVYWGSVRLKPPNLNPVTKRVQALLARAGERFLVSTAERDSGGIEDGCAFDPQDGDLHGSADLRMLIVFSDWG